MATATTDTPQFDLSSAVPETDDGKAISAMPTFDLKSAVPEESLENARPQDNLPEEQSAPLRQQAFDGMKAGIEQIPPSPYSKALRSFIKNVGKGGLEQFKEADFDYQNAANIPIKNEGESDQDFEKRISAFEQPLEQKELAKGIMGQLNDVMTGAIAMAAPEMSPESWTMLGTFMGADVTRQAVQKIFSPNMTPDEKDVLDLISFPLEAGASKAAVEGMGEMIARAFTIKGVSPTIDLSPDLLRLFANPQVTERPVPYVSMSQKGWPAPDILTPTGYMSGGVLGKLGITENHYDVSMGTDIPVRVPITTLFNITQDPQWEDIRQVMNFEGEGGTVQQEGGENATEGRESIESRGGQETPEGEAQAGVHLRDTSQGRMETEKGEVISPVTDGDEKGQMGTDGETQGERGTSKIAESINQKAIEDKLTSGFKDVAGYDKVNIEEQAKLGAETVKDLDSARAIIRGEKPLPDRLRGISLITAMEEHLKAHPDADIAYELANSPLVTETSKAAQELRLAAERMPDSASSKLAEIKKAKIEEAGGDKNLAKSKESVKIKAKAGMDKINLTDKESVNLDKFLDGIAC